MKKTLIFLVFFFVSFLSFCQKNKSCDTTPSIKKINTLGTFSLKVFENKIVFAPKYKKITAPLLYKDDFEKLNFNALYQIENKEGKVGYFRFGWINYENSTNILLRVNWFYNKAPITNNFEEFTIKTVEVSSIQEGNIKVCTVGDSQTWWSDSSRLRKAIDEKAPEFYFTGSNIDVFGYPHEGEGGNSTKSLLQRMNKIPEADYYTLLIGTNDWKNKVDEAAENINTFINYILEKYPSSTIIYLSPLPTTNTVRDEFNKELQARIENLIESNAKVVELDLGGEMRKNKNWQKEYLSYDGLHPNRKGVNFMAEQIAVYIKSQTH